MVYERDIFGLILWVISVFNFERVFLETMVDAVTPVWPRTPHIYIYKSHFFFIPLLRHLLDFLVTIFLFFVSSTNVTNSALSKLTFWHVWLSVVPCLKASVQVVQSWDPGSCLDLPTHQFVLYTLIGLSIKQVQLKTSYISLKINHLRMLHKWSYQLGVAEMFIGY